MVSLEQARALLLEIGQRLRFAGKSGRPRQYPLLVGGSVRRGEAKVGDLDLLVVVPDDVKELPAVSWLPTRAKKSVAECSVVASGPRRRTSYVRLVENKSAGAKKSAKISLDLFLVNKRHRPFALFHHTGSRDYNVRVRSHAKKLGYKLNQYGVFDAKTGKPARGSSKISSEKDIAAFLGVTYRPPFGRT